MPFSVTLALFVIVFLLSGWAGYEARKIAARGRERDRRLNLVPKQIEKRYWRWRHPQRHWPGR